MSHKCPRCGLFSPEEAIRCDCGYDFKTQTVESSYLVAHVLQKHGGEHKILEGLARNNIRNGVLLLTLGIVVSAVGFLASGSLYFFGAAVMWGAIFLYRGLRQRRARWKLVQRDARTDAVPVGLLWFLKRRAGGRTEKEFLRLGTLSPFSASQAQLPPNWSGIAASCAEIAAGARSYSSRTILKLLSDPRLI